MAKHRPHPELKSEIVAIAERIVEAEGLDGLNARKIAQAAGCSVGTLYNLFEHLDGIVRAVNLASIRIMRADLTAGLEAAEPTVETRLIALADAYYDFAREHPNRWCALFRFRSSTPADTEIDVAQEGIFEILRMAVGGDETDDVLQALWAAVHGVVELAASHKFAGVVPGRERGYVHLIVRAGLRGISVLRTEGQL